MEGWVYVMENRAMPGLVKLGQSTHIPEWRARQLSSTSVPYPFTVAYRALVDDYRRVETASKAVLGRCREGKEFYRCGPGQAAEVIRQVAGAAMMYERSSADAQKKTRADQRGTSLKAKVSVAI